MKKLLLILLLVAFGFAQLDAQTAGVRVANGAGQNPATMTKAPKVKHHKKRHHRRRRRHHRRHHHHKKKTAAVVPQATTSTLK